jgi:Predicted phage phi-C31 gp36 major capsid-like protein
VNIKKGLKRIARVFIMGCIMAMFSIFAVPVVGAGKPEQNTGNLEKRLKEIQDRKVEIRGLLDGATPEDLDAFTQELDGLVAEERTIQTKLEIAGKLNSGELRGSVIKPFKADIPEQRNDNPYDSVEYRKAFMNYVTRGVELPAEYRADTNTKTTDIGAMIPETVLNKIIEKMESVGMILPLVTKTAYKGGLTIPTSTVKPVATWVAEGVTSDLQKKTTGSITFAYYKLRCAISVSLETDVMALSAFEATFINNVTEAMVKALEQAVISGSGVGQPKGILIEAAPTGQALEATPTYSDLVAAEAVLPLAYENGAVWCMTKKTFMAFIGMVDSNKQPIARVNTGINGKPERTLLGRQVVLCDYLDTYSATLAAGKIWAFLFRFEDYILNTNYNMTIKKYEDDKTDDQVTKAIMLVDGKVVDVNSLVTLKIAA